MNEQEKKFYSNYYKTSSYQPDLYKLFIELSANISTPTSKICLITPSVFLSNDYDKKIREFILTRFSLSFVSAPNDEVFEEANVSVSIFLLENKALCNNINILQIRNKEFNILNCVIQALFEKDDFIINTAIQSEHFDLIDKINTTGFPLETLFNVKNGIKVRKELLYKSKNDDNFKPFSLGRNINQLGILKSDCFIHYTKENEGLYTNQAFRSPEIFENKKIVIRQIPGKKNIIATIDCENIYTDQTIYNIVPTSEKVELETLLGILTSKLMFFYFKNTSFDNKDLFPKIKRSQLLNLPIIRTNCTELSLVINQISFAKKQNIDTTALESEIDQLVYKLYDLSYEEVKLIDPEFGLSEVEYGAVNVE